MCPSTDIFQLLLFSELTGWYWIITGIFVTVSYLCVCGWVSVWLWVSFSVAQVRVICKVNTVEVNLFTPQMHWFLDSDKTTLNFLPTTESYLYRKQDINAKQDYKNRILEEKKIEFSFVFWASQVAKLFSKCIFPAKIVSEIFQHLNFLV